MRSFSFLFILFLSISLSFSQTQTRKVLFIGIDGCRWDAIQAATTPAIDSLVANSVYSGDGLCAYKTWSGNGWSSMLTGTWHTKHGVTDNSFSGANYSNYPDFLTRIETFNPALKTVSFVNWAPINNTIIQTADSQLNFNTDIEVRNAAMNALTNSNPDLLFVSFDNVDHAGHVYGFSPLISQYIDAIDTMDAHINLILGALRSRPTFLNEDWLIVLTTDHGGTPTGHGGGTIEERNIFSVFSNTGLVPRNLTRTVTHRRDTFDQAVFTSMAYAQPL